MPEHKLTDTAKLRKVKFEILIEHSSAVHFVAKASGNYSATFISGAIENQLGYKPIQFTQDPDFWINHVHPDDRPRIFANRQQLFENPHQVEEHRFMHADGDYRWIHCELVLVRDKDGNPSEIIGTSIDITERKHSEEELKESEARYRNLVENTTDWIWQMGLDFKHTYSNHRVENILGYSTEEFAELSLDKLMHPEDMKAVAAQLPFLIAEKQGWEGWVVRFRHKDGSYRHLESNAHPIFDAAGETCGFRGVDRDITSQNEAAERLRQAQKMEAVGQLTGGMAHNFNNLLVIIVGHLEILKGKSGADEKSVESTQAALDAALRGAELVKRLLAFSGQQCLVPENVNIDDVVKELEPLFKDTLGGDIEVHTKLAGDLWRTTIDKSQLENSLVNLAINARHAMPEGGVLTIETDHVDLAETDVVDDAEIIAGKYVMLAVSDTGSGIPENVMPHIFEPFFTTKEVGEGSGLGLSMVRGFVKQSKGHINVVSKVGCGTTIKIYLPQAVDASQDMEELTASSKCLPCGDETILLVEDETGVRDIAATLLRSLGYRVREANNGSAALDFLATHADIDLLFTDIIMPGGMNGVELANKARRLQPNLKVLYTTGFAVGDHHSDGWSPTSTDVLMKPYLKAELGQTLREVLDRG